MIILLLFFINFSGIIIFITMLIGNLIFLRIIWVIFKGQTGDICGASQQINELIGLLTLTLLI